MQQEKHSDIKQCLMLVKVQTMIQARLHAPADVAECHTVSALAAVQTQTFNKHHTVVAPQASQQTRHLQCLACICALRRAECGVTRGQ